MNSWVEFKLRVWTHLLNKPNLSFIILDSIGRELIFGTYYYYYYYYSWGYILMIKYPNLLNLKYLIYM